jgi:adenylylsulfate kinase
MNPGAILWCTGLSGAGKTTISKIVSKRLREQGQKVLVLDGDEIRNRITTQLGFSEKDIKENNRLISKICSEERARHDFVIVSVISPYRESRDLAKTKLSPGFFEIYFNASLETVENRDIKGLYKQAREGKINNMIGLAESNPYEPPENPDLLINSSVQTIEESTESFLQFIKKEVLR